METKIVEYVTRQLDLSGDDSLYLDVPDDDAVSRYTAALEAAGFKVTMRRGGPYWLEIHDARKAQKGGTK